MASMRDIKRRRESIQSTEQITKAMKLVSTVKLQKSRTKAETTKPYFNMMYETVRAMLEKSANMTHPYLTAGNSGKKAVVLITSNRGLAGGYNSNMIRLIAANGFTPEDTVIYAVGRKGKEGLLRKGFEVPKDYSEVINSPLYQDAAEITQDLLDAFQKGEICEIYLAYTSFKNTVVHIPKLLSLLPVKLEEREQSEQKAALTAPMNYEPNEESALNAIIPKYISSMVYGALMEAAASENGARMNAMDNATSNAEDMIAELSLQYNRARQGSITQELTEIIAGANAIE
ncbi:MAG: ATP synthase F1 subunit gamma [bacterium]|nr:ATP synthase F1 subunit gamma [bacterium]